MLSLIMVVIAGIAVPEEEKQESAEANQAVKSSIAETLQRKSKASILSDSVSSSSHAQANSHD